MCPPGYLPTSAMRSARTTDTSRLHEVSCAARADSGSLPDARYSLRNKIHLLAMGCKYKREIRAFLCIQFGNGAENRSRKRHFRPGSLDYQYLSGVKIGGRLAIIPLEGRDGGVVFAGYAGEGVSAPDLMHALLAGLAGAHGRGFSLG